MKPLICFDMDETLIYSNKCHIKAFNQAFKNQNLPIINEKKFAKLLQGETANIIIKKIFPKLKQITINKIKKDHRNLITNSTYKYAKQIDHSSKILKSLKKNYRIAILSNCNHREILSLLKGSKINHKLFDKVIGSDEVKHAKPYPDEIFKAEKLLHEKALFMIGDSLQDIKAAKKAKVKIISVLTGNTSKSAIISKKPDYILKNVSELIGIL